MEILVLVLLSFSIVEVNKHGYQALLCAPLTHHSTHHYVGYTKTSPTHSHSQLTPACKVQQAVISFGCQ